MDYAEDEADQPVELALIRLVDRFGAYAVLGRPLRARELRAGNLAENVVGAHQSMGKSDNFAQWRQDHEELARIYEYAEAARKEINGEHS